MELGRSAALCVALLCLPTGQALAQHFVSYWPHYRGIDIQAVPALTHLLYAFAEVDENAEVRLPEDLSVLKAVRGAAWRSAARPGLLVGGWNGGDDAHLTRAMASAGGRAHLVASLVAVLKRHALSAVEIDWEYPDNRQEGLQLLAFLTQLRGEVSGLDVSIGLSVPALGPHADVIPVEVFDHIDVLSIMAYDNSGGLHSSRTFFQDSLEYWLARGAPARKIAMGIPAYSRPQPQSYAELVAADARNAWRDTDGTSNWNGLPTVRWKADMALRQGTGIMLWELGQDAPEPVSIAHELSRTLWEFMGDEVRD